MRPTVPGWIYVLASTSHPGVVKIGRTSRNAIERARELDRSEGYRAFGPWNEVWSRCVSDSGHVETAAHRMLAHHRLRIRGTACRELFQLDAEQACAVVEAAAGSLRAAPPMRRRAAPGSYRPQFPKVMRRREAPGSYQFRFPKVWQKRLAILSVCLFLAWMLAPDLLAGIVRDAVHLP